jgi:hypothetical protein
MGLLDDAIREHLELKRRRGDDPAEIERAEREALGPVRRGPEPAPEDLDPGLAIDQPQTEYEGTRSEQWEPFHEDPELEALQDHEHVAPYEPAHGPDGDPLMEDEAFLDHGYGRSVPPEPADLAPAPDAEPGIAAYPPRLPPEQGDPHLDQPPARLDQETEEYDVESEHEAGDDVLETTPEFLQDAPDHDRLWFEQRPPRDFDFDG